jgi:hypothetical protein
MAYPLIEFYYPMVTLTKKGDTTTGFYFENDSLTNTQINFAYKKSSSDAVIKGTAKEYYIYNDPLTKYLVILHRNAELPTTNFYVAFPLMPPPVGKTMSDYLKKDRMNGGLAKSINNLKIITTDTTKTTVKFSLESVIDSMQTFNPTRCLYKTSTEIYIINEPIYVDETVFTGVNYAKKTGLLLDDAFMTSLTNMSTPTIRKVTKVRSCTLPPATVSKKDKGLFGGLNRTDQAMNNYLNLALMLVSALYFIFFFWIYYSTEFLNGEHKMSIVFFMIISIILLVIPVAITTQIYNSKKGAKINVKDLRISITVARYSVVMFAISMFAIFSKKIFEIFNDYTKVLNAFNAWIASFGQNKETILPIVITICGVVIFYHSYIIFLKV